MPAYNFQPRFAALVESGQKRQTIRKTDRGTKPGDTAYLYTGQRTKFCRKIGEGTLTAIQPIKIGRHSLRKPFFGRPFVIDISGEWRYLARCELRALARADGFEDVAEMVEWFERQYGLPFSGYLHQWTLTTEAAP